MKITDLRVYLTRANENRTWVFVEVDTDEGITGVGESTNSGGGGAHMVGRGYELIKEDLDYSDFADGIMAKQLLQSLHNDSYYMYKISCLIENKYNSPNNNANTPTCTCVTCIYRVW